MKKSNSSNKKAKTFTVKGAAAFITAAFIVLTAALVFTGCPNAAGGSGSGGGNIEGVWKAVSATVNSGAPVSYPILNPNPGGGTVQLYYCFSEGKAYLAFEKAENSNPGENGLFQGDPWEEEYTFENNTLKLVGESLAFILTGNTATITIIEDSDTIVTTLERVSLPTAAEIKAAKES